MPKKPIKLDISDEMIAERRGASGKMPKDMPNWMSKSIIWIDKFSKIIGNTVCWITVPLILGMVYEVLARKLFLAPTIWAYDMSRFFAGALFMLGAGYALSKFRFKGMIIIFAIFIGGNFVPPQVLMIPVLRLTQDIGIWNTRYALILFHAAFQTGFCVFFMRNFIAQIPTELLEAARVEGAGEFQIFRIIVLPLVRPAMAALSVLIFSFVWNDFFWSLILSPMSPDGMLAPAGLANIIKGRFYNAYNVLAAGSIIVSLPPVILFFLLQKQFISGLTLGATKG